MARAEDTIRKTIDRARDIAHRAESVAELRFAALLVSNSHELLNSLVKAGAIGSDRALSLIERTAPVRREIITKATQISFRPSRESVSAIGSMAEIYNWEDTMPGWVAHAVSPKRYHRWSQPGLTRAKRTLALMNMTGEIFNRMNALPLLPEYDGHTFKVEFESMRGRSLIVGEVLPNGQLLPLTVLKGGAPVKAAPGKRVIDLTKRLSFDL